MGELGSLVQLVVQTVQNHINKIMNIYTLEHNKKGDSDASHILISYSLDRFINITLMITYILGIWPNTTPHTGRSQVHSRIGLFYYRVVPFVIDPGM